MGLGSAALASLLEPGLFAARPGITGFPNYDAKIKRVIFLCMAGGPAHLELLDHKPELVKRDGEPMPESVTKGQQIAQLQGSELRILAPQNPFKRWGTSGQHFTSLLPHIGGIADDICIIRSLQTEQINHDTAHTFMNTGNRLPGRPSMGSWINLRAGQRVGRPAGLRGADVGGRGSESADCRSSVAFGFSARQIPGGQAELERRPRQLRP